MNWCDVDLDWAYGDLLRSICRSTGSLDHASDVLHDSLVRLAMISQREAILHPRTYLRNIVRTALADRGRDLKRWMPFPDSDESGGPVHPDIAACRTILDYTFDPHAFAPSPERLADLRARLREAQAIVNSLPPKCRQVFWLFRIEGYSQQEIAERLDISLKTVQYHIKRSLLDLLAATPYQFD